MNRTVIAPDVMFPLLNRYRAETELTLSIDEDQAVRLLKQEAGGFLSLDAVVRGMKDALRYPDTSYYARIAEVETIHHGWHFNFLSCTHGREIPLLQGLRFGVSEGGLVSAFFASAILPTIGAFWHGLYERDYAPIESLEELAEIASGGDLKAGSRDYETLLQIPIGLRTSDIFGTKRCRSLCFSESEGLMDIEVVIHPDGRADEASRTVLCEPAHRTLY